MNMLRDQQLWNKLVKMERAEEDLKAIRLHVQENPELVKRVVDLVSRGFLVSLDTHTSRFGDDWDSWESRSTTRFTSPGGFWSWEEETSPGHTENRTTLICGEVPHEFVDILFATDEDLREEFLDIWVFLSGEFNV